MEAAIAGLRMLAGRGLACFTDQAACTACGARRPRPGRHQISLYAHITGLAFALDTIDAPLQRATISDASGSHELRTITVDARTRPAFDTANEVWSLL